MSKIRGINKSSLWEAWKNIRKQLPKASIRDITDYVEFDINPDWWIEKLLKDIETGRYEPASPYRFTLAKKIGFSRQMTFPHIPDLVLYRAVTYHLYKRAKRLEKGHVYFAPGVLSSQRQQIRNTDIDEADYAFLSGSSFKKWLEFDQYRKRVLLSKTYPCIVLTDISNYFDSILYDRVVNAIHAMRVDQKIVGILLFILERLSIRDAFNESPRIGLPVDEFGCSRTLAHMVLFPHDERMIKFAGEKSYVRFMDDQNFGVSSYARGLETLRYCSQSLAKLHLTPNAAKSKILNFKQAGRHFHLAVNAELDKIEDLPKETLAERRVLREQIGNLWRQSRQSERNGGEWKKVLSRFYRWAGVGGAHFLRHRAMRDILQEPTIAMRVSDYMRVTGSARQYADFVSRLWDYEEQVYPDVNRALAEGLLRAEAQGQDALSYRNLASKLLTKQSNRQKLPAWEACTAIAPLLILRFGGDRRSLPRFKKIIRQLDSMPPSIGKAVAVVYASYGRKEYEEVVQAASTLRDNYLSEFLRMLAGLLEYENVPERFKIRRKPVYDPVLGRCRVDMRKLLVLRLLRLNHKKPVGKWIDDTRQWMQNQSISSFDKSLVEKLLS